VKKFNKITALIFVALLYCYAVGFVNNAPNNAPIIKTSGTENETYFSVVTFHLFHHTTQSENSLHSVCKIPSRILEEPFYKFSLIKENTERIIVHSFTHYTSISQNFLILYRKFNIIFPFHNFW